MAQGKYTVTSTIQLLKIRCLFVSDGNLERPCSWVGGKASWSHWTSCRGWQGGHSFHALPPRIQCRCNAMRHCHQRPHHSRLESGETQVCIARLKPDGTLAETRFRLSPKRTSPFKSAGASVQSTAGSRVVRISGSNAGYTTFRGSVRVLATHSIRQFPLNFLPVRHRVPSGFKCTIALSLSLTVCVPFAILE